MRPHSTVSIADMTAADLADERGGLVGGSGLNLWKNRTVVTFLAVAIAGILLAGCSTSEKSADWPKIIYEGPPSKPETHRIAEQLRREAEEAFRRAETMMAGPLKPDSKQAAQALALYREAAEKGHIGARDALARLHEGGENYDAAQMKTAAVVSNRQAAVVSGPISRNSVFSDYDDRLKQTIDDRWRELLPKKGASKGTVVLRFRLTFKGEIADLRVIRATVGDSLVEICKRAVSEPAPYPPWPAQMRRILGNRREMTFTFNFE